MNDMAQTSLDLLKRTRERMIKENNEAMISFRDNIGSLNEAIIKLEYALKQQAPAPKLVTRFVNVYERGTGQILYDTHEAAERASAFAKVERMGKWVRTEAIVIEVPA